MINRVLIRIKTVQLLYSYLLVQKPFSLESQPSSPTKEKRYAYSLYLDMVYLMYDLAGKIIGKNGKESLKETRFIKKLSQDDRIKSLIIKYADGSFPFRNCEDVLAENIKKSLLFREFEKHKDSDESADRIWEEIYFNIIITSPDVNEIAKTLPNYSISGQERTKEMMRETFRNFYTTRDNIDDALATLSHSMQKARELYMRLLLLPIDLTELRQQQLEDNRRKFLATPEDLNPDMSFVDNRLPGLIEQNSLFSDYIEKHKLSWLSEDRTLLESILKDILASDLYGQYLTRENHDLSSDIEFWRDVFKQIIFQNPQFLEYLENKSVFWNDDLEITGTFLLKTLKKFEKADSDSSAVMPMFKDKEDSEFGSSLFADVLRNKEKYRGYIEDSLANERWEADRLAFMDVVITMTAISEIINYPKIPLVVSINEYIEIAKSYSSSKSGAFVNGLLASITKKLREEGVINK